MLRQLLEILRSNLQNNNRTLTPEQSYILSPQNASKWIFKSAQPLMFIFPRDPTGETPVNRKWELLYDPQKQHLFLKPIFHQEETSKSQ